MESLLTGIAWGLVFAGAIWALLAVAVGGSLLVTGQLF